MAAYTVQFHSASGSFASPWGTDVKHFDNLRGVRDGLEDWSDQHALVGSERTDAHALVYAGHHEDVTDLYPEFELSVGPRGGVKRQQC